MAGGVEAPGGGEVDGYVGDFAVGGGGGYVLRLSLPQEVHGHGGLFGRGWGVQAERDVVAEFTDGVGVGAAKDEGFVGDAGAPAQVGAEGGLFEPLDEVVQERVGALDGEGEDGVGEVDTPADEGGLGLGAVAAVAGAQALFVGAAAAGCVEVGVALAGPVDADGELQVRVRDLVGVGVGGEGFFSRASVGGGEQADEGGAGGEGEGVAVVEGGVFPEGHQRGGQAQQDAVHAAARVREGWAAVWVRAPVRSSKPVCTVPRWSTGASCAVA